MSINYNLDKYLKNQTIAPLQILTYIIEDKTKKTFEQLRKEIDNCNVYLTRAQIEDFLTEQKKKNTKSLTAKKHNINPYTLKFFRRYINTLKGKTLALLNLIEKLGKKELESIEELINKLDITIIDKEFISCEDIERIIFPTIYNILDIFEKNKAANTPETYLTFTDPLNIIINKGGCERDLYPSQELQINYVAQNYIPGYVPLSQNQINNTKKTKGSNLEKWTKFTIENLSPEKPPKTFIKQI